MNPTHQRGSLKADVLVALVAAMGSGLVVVPLSGAGWLATKLSAPVLIVVAIAIGVAAGFLSSRRKPPMAGLTLKRERPER